MFDHVLQRTNSKKAARLRKSADGMQKQIDAKRNPPISEQRITARRARITAHMEKEADHIEEIQFKLYTLADLHEKGGVPAGLENVNSGTDIKRLMSYRELPGPVLSHWGPQRITEREKELRAFTKMGITSNACFNQTWDDLKALGNVEKTPEQIQAERITTMERDLIGQKIPGYFPTPKELVSKMIFAANLRQHGLTILEPSAGKGDVADEIRRLYPNLNLNVVEWDYSLREILKAKGHNVVGTDFLKHDEYYDRIIMNPPFEKGQDIDHVRHAYNLLNPSGAIVSIMSEGTFCRQDKKATTFRKWLSLVEGTSKKLEQGIFQASERPTGVASRIVVIKES